MELIPEQNGGFEFVDKAALRYKRSRNLHKSDAVQKYQTQGMKPFQTMLGQSEVERIIHVQESNISRVNVQKNFKNKFQSKMFLDKIFIQRQALAKLKEENQIQQPSIYNEDMHDFLKSCRNEKIQQALQDLSVSPDKQQDITRNQLLGQNLNQLQSFQNEYRSYKIKHNGDRKQLKQLIESVQKEDMSKADMSPIKSRNSKEGRVNHSIWSSESFAGMKNHSQKIFHSFQNDRQREKDTFLPPVDLINRLVYQVKQSNSPQRSPERAIKKSTSRIIDEFIIRESSSRRDLILNEITSSKLSSTLLGNLKDESSHSKKTSILMKFVKKPVLTQNYQVQQQYLPSNRKKSQKTTERQNEHEERSSRQNKLADLSFPHLTSEMQPTSLMCSLFNKLSMLTRRQKLAKGENQTQNPENIEVQPQYQQMQQQQTQQHLNSYHTKQLMRVIVNMNGRRANPDNATPTYSTEEDDDQSSIDGWGRSSCRQQLITHQNKYQEEETAKEKVQLGQVQVLTKQIKLKKGKKAIMRTSRYKNQNSRIYDCKIEDQDLFQ